jgi:hypothetical protein
MNPRLVEPGFVVVQLHAGGPARPGKDEDGDDEAQRGRHVRRHDTGRARQRASPTLDARRRYARSVVAHSLSVVGAMPKAFAFAGMSTS